MNAIKLCLLNNEGSMESFLMDLFKLSKQQIKKYKFNKKFLKLEARKNMELELPIDLVNHDFINPSYTGQNVEVLFSDEYFIVLNKPNKVHMCALKYSDTDNLLSFLRKYDSKLLEVNKSNNDRGLIYRLDYETSGIVYYAKSQIVYEQMRSTFHEVMQEKSYFAIVEGKFENDGMHIHFLKSSGLKGSKMLVSDDEVENSQLAKINVRILDYNSKENVTLLKVSLKTGLRHQIRCQLSHLGHPIVGDELYGAKPAQRLFLHANQYKFEYKSKSYSYACDVDSLFESFFNFNSST